jgi:hypothetical protein
MRFLALLALFSCFCFGADKPHDPKGPDEVGDVIGKLVANADAQGLNTHTEEVCAEIAKEAQAQFTNTEIKAGTPADRMIPLPSFTCTMPDGTVYLFMMGRGEFQMKVVRVKNRPTLGDQTGFTLELVATGHPGVGFTYVFELTENATGRRWLVVNNSGEGTAITEITK